MKTETLVSAKTLDDAIMQGCEELGVSLDEVNFQVEEAGGLFRKMKVRVSLKNAPAADGDASDNTNTDQADAKVTTDGDATDNATVTKVAAANTADDAPTVEEFEIVGKVRAPKKANDGEKARTMTEFDENCPKFVQTRTFAEKFFGLMGDNLTITTSHDDQEYLISVDGEDVGRLIGKNGKTLAAINTIISSIAVNTHSGEPRRVVVDIANYREQRRLHLIELAKRKAEQVKNTGRAVRLDPMPARERVIVHLALQDVEGVITESEGVEPQRFLVIKPGAR